VGKGCRNRAYQIDKSRNIGFMNVLRKTEVAVVILAGNLTEQEAYEMEVWFIYEYKHIYNFGLVNLDEGGLGALSGKFNHMYGKRGELHPNFGRIPSKETRLKMSLARQGSKNHMYGRRGELSPLKGRVKSERERLKISQALKGIQRSESHIENLKKSLAQRNFYGKNNPNYGNGYKIAGLNNVSATKVTVINPDTLVEFEGCKKEVCQKYGISLYLLTKLGNRKINVELDFNREKKKFSHLNGYEFKME
jgi:hypothetical protein